MLANTPGILDPTRMRRRPNLARIVFSAGLATWLLLMSTTRAAAAFQATPDEQTTSTLEQICSYLEQDNPNQRAAARRQLREAVGTRELKTLRAYLERRLPANSWQALADRHRELLELRLDEIENEIQAFESARNLAREQAREYEVDPSNDNAERLRQTRLARDEAYQRSHRGFDDLAQQSLALAPALWHRAQRGGAQSAATRRCYEKLWQALLAEARRTFPTAPRAGTVSPFTERSLTPLVSDLVSDLVAGGVTAGGVTAGGVTAGGVTAGNDDGTVAAGWSEFRERVAQRAIRQFQELRSESRQRARAVFLELHEWGRERLATWLDEESSLPRFVRAKLQQWNLLQVPPGFEEQNALELANYAEQTAEQRQRILYRLEWVGGDTAIPIFARLLELEEDLSLKVECAAALARARDPRGGMFLRQLGLAEAVALEAMSRDVLLIEAIHKREGGELEGALQDLLAIERRYPPNFRLHYEIAFTALQLRRLDLSIRHFQLAMKFDANDSNTHYNLACAHALNQNLDLAFSALRQAVAAGFSDPEHARQDDDLQSLREDPRFEEILELMRP